MSIRQFNLLLTIIALLLSDSLYAQNIISSIMHDGQERGYILYIPDSYDAAQPAPLVLNLHGLGSNASEQSLYSNFSPIADNHGFLVVHPEGLLNSNGAQHWNANWGTGVDDIGFLSALIDSLSAGYNVDLNRVYSTGMSNGGFMSYTLACQLSDRIAAIASVTGTMTIGQTLLCDEPKAVPVMEIHGTADGVVPYNGSTFATSIEDVVDFWVNKNACDTDSQFSMVEDIVMTDGCTAEHYMYGNGTDGSSVELYKIIGGGHTWPGSVIVIGVTNQDINASEKIWEFFSKYTLEGLVITNEEAVNQDDFITFMPNPVADVIRIQFKNEMTNRFIKIYDTLGKMVRQMQVPNNNARIDVSDWTPAAYFVQICVDSECVTKKILVTP